MKRLLMLMMVVLTTSTFGQELETAWVKTETIRYAEMTYQLSGYGVMTASPEAQFNANVPRQGQISKVYVLPGKKIKKGEPLYELITAASVLKGFNQAQLQLKTAQKEFERVQRLYQDKLASNSQLTNAKKALFDAESSLNAEIKLGNNIQRDIIRSPFSGVVTLVSIESGMRVQPAQSAITVVADKGLYFQMGVLPELVSSLAINTPVHISSVFDPGVIINGHIKYITGMVDQTTGLVNLFVDVNDTHLSPGMRMQGNIQINLGKKWQVPRSAVLSDDQGYYIFQIRDNHAKRINVQAKEYDEITVIEGPFDKDLPVVVLGNYELKEGMAVKVTQ